MSQPIQIPNIFTDGLKTDLDNLLQTNRSFFEAKDIRIINKAGQAFVVTTIAGNEEEFQISDKFIPLAVEEYDGIAYIFSVKNVDSSDIGYGEGEIGCFPSPKAITSWDETTGIAVYDTSVIGFERVYKPLLSIDDGVNKKICRTTAFNFNRENQISSASRVDSDNQVILYFTDHNNPLRRIKNNFDKDTGQLLEDWVLESSFKSSIENLLSVSTLAEIQDVDINTGGTLKSGTTFFFFRYATQNLNRTTFFIHTNGIRLYSGPAPGNSGTFHQINGVTGVPGTTGTDDITNKKVRVELSNLDNNYEYIEIGYLRYYSDELGVTVFEANLIDSLYSFSSGSVTIDITGNEGLVDFTLEELILQPIRDNTPKHITISENRLWGVNWKSKNIHHPDLATYANKIIASYSISETDDRFAYRVGNLASTFEGYFRGEPYPFSIVFILTSGIETDAYPTTGLDLYNSSVGAATQNSDGITRFPDNVSEPHMGTNPNPSSWGTRLRMMAVEFRMSNAYIFLQTSTWMQENVIGFYFCRGDRKKNLQYQAVSLPGTCSHMNSTDGWILQPPYDTSNPEWSGFQSISYAGNTSGVYRPNLPDSINTSSHREALGIVHTTNWYSRSGSSGLFNFDLNKTRAVIPLFEGMYPCVLSQNYIISGGSPVIGTDIDGWRWKNYSSIGFYEKNKYGLYSTDYIFDPGARASGNVVVNIGKISYNRTLSNTNGETYNLHQVYPRTVFATPNTFLPSTTLNNNVYNIREIVDVDKYLTVIDRVSGFCSYVPDPGITPDGNAGLNEDQCFLYLKFRESTDRLRVYGNRSFSTTKYMGLVLNTEDLLEPHTMFNVYSYDPADITDITSLFDIYNIRYSRITRNYDINTNYDVSAWSGDCFLQSTVIRQLSYAGSTLIEEEEDYAYTDEPDYGAGNVFPAYTRMGHGLYLKVVTENAINTVGRYKKDRNTFVPLSAPTDADVRERAYSHIDNTELTESFFYNEGYSSTIVPNAKILHDDRYESSTQFPVRVRHSDLHVPGEIFDDMRSWKESAYVDYDINDGPMNYITALFGYVMTVQDHAINQHFTSEQTLRSTTEAGDLVLGLGPVISPKVRKIASFGSQNQWSIKSTGNAAYGIDYLERIIWQVRLVSSDKGSFLGASDISREKEIQKEVYDYLEDIYARTDVLNVFPDNPVYKGGIATFFRAKYKEVYFSFLFTRLDLLDSNVQLSSGCNALVGVDGSNYAIGDFIYLEHVNTGEIFERKVILVGSGVIQFSPAFSPCTIYPDGYLWEFFNVYTGVPLSKTLCYGEDRAEFIGDRTLNTAIGFNIGNDFFSFERQLPERYPVFMTGNVYIHNDDSPMTIFGESYNPFVSCLINLPKNNQMIEMPKVYDAMEATASREGFLSTQYETENQTSLHTWPVPGDPVRRYLDPDFKEEKWFYPINVQTSADLNEYKTGSQMRGLWMKVKITFRNDTLTWLKELATKLRISNQ